MALFAAIASIVVANNYISACNGDLSDANRLIFGNDNGARGCQKRISIEPQVNPPPNASISTS